MDMKGLSMIPAFLRYPRVTPAVDGGGAYTVTPPLPFFVYDGGSSSGTSNPSLDGGSAVPKFTDTCGD